MELIIGDIHGCWDEFQALLDKAGPGPSDRIIAVGDIVDRGPESEKVLEFFRSTPNALTIMGNHERKHISSFERRVRPALSQKIVRHEVGERYPPWIDFFRALPLCLRLSEALVVHGFFEPGVPLEQQRDTVLCGTMSGQGYLEQRYSQPWYELYQGSPIIVGHRDYLCTGEPFVFRDIVYGIDTRGYEGGRLTGLILPGFRLISVPAMKNYRAEARRHYAWLAHPPDEDARLEWDKVESIARGTDERAAALRRIHEIAREGARSVIGKIAEQVADWRRGAVDEQAFAHAIHERLGPGEPNEWMYQMAVKGRLTEAAVFRKHSTPARMFVFLAAVPDLAGPVPTLTSLLPAPAESDEDAE